MKIALCFPGCHRRGGVERVLFESANFLAARGHEVHVFASVWDEEGLSSAVHRHPIFLPGWLPAALQPPWFVRACRQPMLALQPPADILAGFGAIAPEDGVVWMTSVHAAWIEISRRSRNFQGRLKQWINPFHFIILKMEKARVGERGYRKLIALTVNERDAIEGIYKIPAGEIAVIPNGFSGADFNVARCDAIRSTRRAELGYTEKDRVILFVANEMERKGFGPLLRAMAALDDASLKLLAVGRLDPGEAAGEIRSLGLEDRVQFTGATSDATLFYAAADVFVLPTKYEAWGLVIVEAMACGLPVLTSRLAGAAVAVLEGKSGILLDNPTDAAEIARKLREILDGEIFKKTGRYFRLGAAFRMVAPFTFLRRNPPGCR